MARPGGRRWLPRSTHDRPRPARARAMGYDQRPKSCWPCWSSSVSSSGSLVWWFSASSSERRAP